MDVNSPVILIFPEPASFWEGLLCILKILTVTEKEILFHLFKILVD